MTIKLKGSTDGSVSFTAPAGTSPAGSDIELTLPTTAGSADQFLKNSGIAGTLEYSSMVENATGVGIGTSNPAGILHLSSAASARFFLEGNDGRSEIRAGNGNLEFFTNQDANASGLNNTIFYRTGATESMRITSGGSIQINGTYSAGSNRISLGPTTSNFSRDTTAAAAHIYFENPNGTVGQIQTNGTSTSYITSSDYRLKENVVDIADGITRVKQLSPKRFNFISDADTTVDGFLAHETQTVVPEAVTGTHDEVDDDGNAVMQGIDQSKLVPLLTAALQEAIAKIETLETKVAALEAGS